MKKVLYVGTVIGLTLVSIGLMYQGAQSYYRDTVSSGYTKDPIARLTCKVPLPLDNGEVAPANTVIDVVDPAANKFVLVDPWFQVYTGQIPKDKVNECYLQEYLQTDEAGYG